MPRADNAYEGSRIFRFLLWQQIRSILLNTPGPRCFGRHLRPRVLTLMFFGDRVASWMPRTVLESNLAAYESAAVTAISDQGGFGNLNARGRLEIEIRRQSFCADIACCIIVVSCAGREFTNHAAGQNEAACRVCHAAHIGSGAGRSMPSY